MTTQDPELDHLIAQARDARVQAYAPYSGFRVGAAVRSASGRIYAGCNVENASYGATICAERCAIFTMVAAGERELSAVAVFTESDELTMPCGMCRQVIQEFARDALIVVANLASHRTLPFSALFPEPFVLER